MRAAEESGGGPPDWVMKPLVSVASKFATDPGTFLFDLFHENINNATPLHMGKVVEIGTNLFPATLPMLELNIAGKARVKREHGGWPQIDVIGSYWNWLPALIAPSLISDMEAKPNLYGYNLGFNVATTLDPRMRVFIGYEYSALRFDIEGLDAMLAGDESTSSTGFDSSGFDLADTLPDAFHVGKTEHYINVGSELLRTPVKRLAAYVGYGLTSSRFVARLTWESKWISSGLAFYPDGALVFWPAANFQVRF